MSGKRRECVKVSTVTHGPPEPSFQSPPTHYSYQHFTFCSRMCLPKHVSLRLAPPRHCIRGSARNPQGSPPLVCTLAMRFAAAAGLAVSTLPNSARRPVGAHAQHARHRPRPQHLQHPAARPGGQSKTGPAAPCVSVGRAPDMTRYHHTPRPNAGSGVAAATCARPGFVLFAEIPHSQHSTIDITALRAAPPVPLQLPALPPATPHTTVRSQQSSSLAS